MRPVFGRVLDGPGSIYFDIGSYKTNTASAGQELKAVENNLAKYPDSTVVVEAAIGDMAAALEPSNSNFTDNKRKP
jgi:hypothetical protein